MKKEEQAKFDEDQAKATIINLEKEAAGYKARGLDERVKEVQAEIARIKKDKRVTPVKAEAKDTSSGD